MQARFVADPAWESIAFLLAPESIRAYLTARQREADFRLPQGVEALRSNGEKVRALFDWGKRLVDTAARQPDLFNEHRDERVAAYVELLETLPATLGETNGFEADRSDRTRQAQSRIVKAAEDHALSNPGDRLFVSDLCRAAAVSERTLENAFKEVMGLAPMSYLVRLRLHRVRQSLLAGTPGNDHGVGRGDAVGLLALRRLLARLQGLLRRAAVGHFAAETGRDKALSHRGPTSGPPAVSVEKARQAIPDQTRDRTRARLLTGDQGYFREGPQPAQASFYVSQPQLQVRADLQRDGATRSRAGRAWLDHEWSSTLLERDAAGRDWVGPPTFSSKSLHVPLRPAEQAEP